MLFPFNLSPQFYPILSFSILSYPSLSHPILSYPSLSYPLLSYPSLSDFTLLPFILVWFVSLTLFHFSSLISFSFLLFCSDDFSDQSGADDSCNVLLGGTPADAHGVPVLLPLVPHVQVPATVRVHKQRSIGWIHVVGRRGQARAYILFRSTTQAFSSVLLCWP